MLPSPSLNNDRQYDLLVQNSLLDRFPCKERSNSGAGWPLASGGPRRSSEGMDRQADTAFPSQELSAAYHHQEQLDGAAGGLEDESHPASNFACSPFSSQGLPIVDLDENVTVLSGGPVSETCVQVTDDTHISD